MDALPHPQPPISTKRLGLSAALLLAVLLPSTPAQTAPTAVPRFVVAGTVWQGAVRGDAGAAGHFRIRVDAIGGHASGSLSGSVGGGLFACALKGPVSGMDVALRCRGMQMNGTLKLALRRSGAEGRFEGELNRKPIALLASARRTRTRR